MKKKIVITGGLGYIGTELCRIYSGSSWYNKIVVIDNRFISERVSQLRNWGIEFVNGDILEKDLLKEILFDADVVHHLAGITDVSRTKKESNIEKDEKINLVALEGTKNVILSTPKNCKIIFPSTHVIYEATKSEKNNITENESPEPALVYSRGKVQNEEQIKKSGKNYVILRLGSVYGYSNDATRLDIMPNLFSKIASQNGTIKLFSGGKQMKSLVSLMDVVRCFKFMEENEDIKFETFNVVKESVSVKEVAEICKKNNSRIELRNTNDEAPNLGYTLSNKKLLGKNFKFLHRLNESIEEMIAKWSEQKINNNAKGRSRKSNVPLFINNNEIIAKIKKSNVSLFFS